MRANWYSTPRTPETRHSTQCLVLNVHLSILGLLAAFSPGPFPPAFGLFTMGTLRITVPRICALNILRKVMVSTGKTLQKLGFGMPWFTYVWLLWDELIVSIHRPFIQSLAVTPWNTWHGTWTSPLWKGNSSSESPFWGSMSWNLFKVIFSFLPRYSSPSDHHHHLGPNIVGLFSKHPGHAHPRC